MVLVLEKGRRRIMRTLQEFLTDGAMTLAVLHLVTPEGAAGDRLKVMKLLFLTTEEMFKRRWKGLNFSFWRYSYGPFTTQVYETWEDLSWTGFLSIESGPTGQIRLTEAGRKMAQSFVAEVLDRPDNKDFLGVLKRIQDTYAMLSTWELLLRVYAMEVQPVDWSSKVPIGKAPIGVFLTRRLNPREAAKSLKVGTEWLKNFDIERHKAQARGSAELAKAYQALIPEVLRGLEESLAADERGEGLRTSIEDLRKRYGIQ